MEFWYSLDILTLRLSIFIWGSYLRGRQFHFSWAETSRWGCGICHITGFIL